jgi:TatA/E family protein of Tat protein translocase
MEMVLGFLTMSPGELAVIALLALVLFGPEKLPEIGKQIGLAYRELNRLRGDVQRALDIDEYTHFELPDISAPSAPTYTYNPARFDDENFGQDASFLAPDMTGHSANAPLLLDAPPELPMVSEETTLRQSDRAVEPIIGDTEVGARGLTLTDDGLEKTLLPENEMSDSRLMRP